MPQYGYEGDVFFMSYQQLHAGKVKLSGLAGIRHHLLDRERVKTNPDIDLSRSQLNHTIENLSPKNLISDVRQRIKQLQLKRKPRTDAVGIMDIIVGASNDFMLQLGEEKREQYFADSLHFFQKHYGKENVMYCHCHMDESNPHIHIGVLPVTPDGRLSARDLFNPKSLEKLQTDFHRDVSKNYGLERGEHQARNYLELNKFKLQRTKQEIQELTADLDSSLLQQTNINEIMQSAHFVSSGFLIKTEDKERSEMPTQKLLQLRQTAEQGVKANAAVRITQQQNSQLKHEKAQALADSQHYLHLFQALEKETAIYTAVPELWREHVNSSILNWQKTFSAYCHDVHVHKYVSNVIHAANLQHKENCQPATPPPAWKSPKPSETDYSKPDELGIVPLRLSSVPDIDWNLINWELLSELDKDEIKKLDILLDNFF